MHDGMDGSQPNLSPIKTISITGCDVTHSESLNGKDTLIKISNEAIIVRGRN